MNNSTEDESVFSAVTRIPIAPFSSFLNDLNRPFFLNNLCPSSEIVKTGVNFPESIEAPENIPAELFDCPTFNTSKIILNDVPVKAITHEYDDFMFKVLEQCYEVQPINVKDNQMTIPKAITTPIKYVPIKPVNTTISTPTALKIKLNVANGSGSHVNSSETLKKLVNDESFVNPLCFDCVQDLTQIAKVIRSFVLSPPQPRDSEIFDSISPTLTRYIEEFIENLDQSSESIDPIKAVYCMSLIGLLNISRLSSNDSLKDYNSFDLVMRLYAFDISGASDLTLSVVIESYVALLTKFKVHDSEVSSYSSHLFNLCFEASGILSKQSSIIAIAQVFSKYPEYRSYIIDQLLIKSIDSEMVEIQKNSSIIIMTCLQALSQSDDQNKASLISSVLTSCLSYCWKGEGGNELPRGSNVFFILIDELQKNYSDSNWPIASFALNQCTIQMFHYLLKDESSNNSSSSKGSLILKMRLLDILANISKLISSSSSSGNSEKRSLWQSISQNILFSAILSPKNAFESLNQSASVYDHELYNSFLQSGPLSKIPERVTGLFIKLISCEVTQLRSKAIKNLFNLVSSSQLCKSNYDALKANIMIKASDPSISVRDAVLEFVSKLIFTPPPFETDSTDLIQSVLSRIKDRGVSVRKRAVKVIGEVLQKGIVDGSDIKLACVGGLISHIADEEDEVIIDAIFKTLKEQWIMCYIGKDFINAMPAIQRKLMSSFSEEVVKVISFLQSDIKCLQDFLGRFLVDESIKKEYSIFFAGTVEVLLENLLQSLERNDFKSLKTSLESIYLFSESNPQSLENHLGLLQNLIRSEDSEISLLSMKLISGVIPKASLTEMKKLQDFEKDLLGLIYRGSEISVKLSIEVLYHYVNNCSHQYGTLSGLWQRFTEYLKIKMQDGFEFIEPSTIPHICRALLATGVLCAQSARHRELEFGMKDFHAGAQAHCLLEFVSYFSKSSSSFINSCAIQAFGSLILACPQVSISSSNIVRSLITSALSETEDDSCKLKMLGIFDQMVKIFNLETEIPNIEANNTKNNILTMEGDESYFSALIQEHFSKISNCVISSDALEVRALALKICSTSAIIGLVNPQLIIPYLAIGLNSENDHIQAYSRSGYERLLARFPSLMSKDLLTPCKLLYRQCKNKNNSLCAISSRLSFYYSSLRGKTGKTGIEALNGVFSWFEEIITSKLKSEDCEFIKFIIETILTLPFSNSDEILNCLQKIQGIFSISSDWISSNLKNQFVLLKGLSYSVNFLIKSYPQILGMTIIEQDSNSNNASKNIQRNSLIQFEFPKIIGSDFTIEMIQEIIANQDPIPNLLLQEPKNFKKRQRNIENGNFDIYENENEIEDDADVSSLLVNDEEISESETDDSDDENAELAILKQFSYKRSQPKQVTKSVQKPNNKAKKRR